MAETRVSTISRAFVLGAGFSAGAGFPLVRNLKEQVIHHAQSLSRCKPWFEPGNGGFEKGQFYAGLEMVDPKGSLQFEEILIALGNHLKRANGWDPCHRTFDALRDSCGHLLWKKQESIEKVMAGPERRSRVIPEKERRIIAHHEAGHALVRRLIPECDPVHKVSIVARSAAGGYVISMPAEDRFLENQSKFEAELSAMLGGRAAEEIIFSQVTTGASDDLNKATKLARSMVTQYGMSKKLGPLTFGEKDELVFLGKDIGEQRNYSEQIARQIDGEVRRIVGSAYDKSLSLLRERRAKLEEIAERLLKDETLDAQNFEAVFA